MLLALATMALTAGAAALPAARFDVSVALALTVDAAALPAARFDVSVALAEAEDVAAGLPAARFDVSVALWLPVDAVAWLAGRFAVPVEQLSICGGIEKRGMAHLLRRHRTEKYDKPGAKAAVGLSGSGITAPNL